MRRIIYGTAASIIIMTCIASGHATYIGYSGASGSGGRCASSCHGSGGGTIHASGFPPEYIPGQIYTISIAHSGGTTIRQFNGSCRIGTGSQNAGVIASGTRTVTYNTGGETNGIHLSTTNQDSCTFQWTAPQAGTGTVRLYIAGQQGSSGGANTSLTLVATEQMTGIEEEDEISHDFALLNNFPNPFNAQTTLDYSLPVDGPVTLEVYDLLGRKIETLFEGFQSAGEHWIIWDGGDQTSGVYFYRIRTENKTETKKMTLMK
jgi:hypothetical protein